MPIPATWSARLLSVMRIVVALVFFSHGISKFFGLPPFPMPMNPLLYAAGGLEVVGGGLLIVGLFTWMVFIGAAAAVRSRTHIRIEVMGALFRHPKMGWLNTVTVLIGIAIVAVAIVACWDQVQQEVGVESPMLGVSKAWFAASMPVGLVLMLVHVVRLWADEGAAPVFRSAAETLVEQAVGARES